MELTWHLINDEHNIDIINFETLLINNKSNIEITAQNAAGGLLCESVPVFSGNTTTETIAAPFCGGTITAAIAPIKDEIVCNKIDNIDEIINIKNYKIFNPLEIIEKQIKVIDSVMKHFRLYRLENIEFIKKNLAWIGASSEYLTILIKQPINKNKTNNLMRSSYKFCNKKTDCQCQYGFLFNKKSKYCINDHYVHNKILSDIENLLNYIQKNSSLNILEQDIRKGIETINYVLNHMYQELSSFMLYLPKSKYTIKDFYKYYNRH
jgi:hypothetical protein